MGDESNRTEDLVPVSTGRRRRVAPDLAPLRESDQYRKLYVSQAMAGLGRQALLVASAYQVFLLTGSSFVVGLFSLVQLVPLLICSFVGGALADAFDRRRLLLAAQAALGLAGVILALNAASDNPRVWVVFVTTSAAAGAAAIDGPARVSSIPSMVRRDQVPAAQALVQVQSQITGIVGPALGGLIIAQASVAAAYWMFVAACVLTFIAQARMRSMLPEGGGTRPSLGSVMEGLRYAREQPVILGVMLADLNAMLFGMPRALFPELGTEHFGGGAATVGLLYAAPAVGALFAAVTAGWVSHVRHHGRVVILCIAAWGIAISIFGLVPNLPLALVMLAIAGGADVISATLRSTIMQLQTPDRLRGRLWSLNIAIVSGSPRLGDVRAGTMSAVTSPQFAVVSGGLACVAGIGILARLLPQLSTWTPPRYPPGQGDGDPPLLTGLTDVTDLTGFTDIPRMEGQPPDAEKTS
jgi:ENTS family enterobactin (siderophore) exporter